MFDSVWKVKLILEAKFPQLPILKNISVRRIMKIYAGCRYVKASNRPHKVFTDQHSKDRVTFAKLFLALHAAGAYFTYTDESSF